ncbi:TDP-N-acetylfucosamine:lipid II N-acetylfucosaminyltransferase family protein [Serratia fonticola]|uniref:TDP-N-acetylfucosamine:lipid II N-acetylfucosaminyltransferase n=5 Tax=Serratia fonticola TaxID=47917 RepID=UPI002DB5E60E|nr:TDP-N-acetylfucosamine:lipid II N-acetylfucosaminyltransferase [Serratia fonticola]MEB7883348.1 TDP-N-acetylfucosamine:lipid II N-acetylfucosaminyltransferase [Serratia fonticola]
MKKLKILHLCTDEKFIDRAINTFESAYPNQNILCLYNKGETISHIKRKVDLKAGFKESLFGMDFSIVGKIDVLVVHSLRDFWFRTIERLDKSIPIVWIGWGYDYYDLMGGRDKWLLEKTNILFNQTKKNISIKQYVKNLVLYPFFRRVKCIERIQYFSPVIPDEYNLLKKCRNWRKFPEQVSWNYCAAEKDLSCYVFDHQDLKRENILVGNSATITNNHLEIFNTLKDIQLRERKLIVPLNYGDMEYGFKVQRIANKIFGVNADVLVDFMPLDQYIEKINSCGYVIMNHIRQQGVGNIVVMTYFGAKIFLREENPTFRFLKNEGAVIFSIQELERNSELLSKPLSIYEVTKNRKVIEGIWSDEILLEKTKKLISALTAIKEG